MCDLFEVENENLKFAICTIINNFKYNNTVKSILIAENKGLKFDISNISVFMGENKRIEFNDDKPREIIELYETNREMVATIYKKLYEKYIDNVNDDITQNYDISEDELYNTSTKYFDMYNSKVENESLKEDLSFLVNENIELEKEIQILRKENDLLWESYYNKLL